MSSAGAAIRDERRDPVRAARRAGLHYVDDATPGIKRLRKGKGFCFLDARGRPVTNARTLARIRALAIPPAWEQVWICPTESGHIQATGRDARGRKQYRYHAAFRAQRDAVKYERIFDFARALPAIRLAVKRQLGRAALSREKLLATVVHLLDRTHLRIGNEEYTRLNKSFGLTTLRNRHARVRGATLELRFRGKAGIERRVRLVDRRLAAIVKRCQELPGEHLFQYLDDEGAPRSLGSSDVNDFLREISGEDFTAKDFRTWAATVHAAVALAALGTADTQRERKRLLREAIEQTAQRLGNTPTICRTCYIHPSIMEAHAAGTVLPALREVATARAAGLRPEEKAVLVFLRRLARATKPASAGPARAQRSR